MSEEKLTEDIPAEEMAEIEEQEGEAGEPETAEEPSLEEQIEAANEEAAKNLDSFLRAQAELSNARKRFGDHSISSQRHQIAFKQ